MEMNVLYANKDFMLVKMDLNVFRILLMGSKGIYKTVWNINLIQLVWNVYNVQKGNIQMESKYVLIILHREIMGMFRIAKNIYMLMEL